MMSELRAVEICAGAGGQSLGLHRAGFRHELAVELDESAATTLRHNLERLQGQVSVAVGDVADPTVWDPAAYEGIDLVAGGVPCPPFSVAGKQLGSADERDLFAWAVELAGATKPRALLLENVRGLSAPRFSAYRQAVADRLGELGYWSEWRLLRANEFGVPQLRPRFVLVALQESLAAHFHWPEAKLTDRTVGSELRDLMASHGWRYADRWAEAAAGIAPTIVGGSKKHGGADLGPTRAKLAWAQLSVDGKGIADAAPSRSDPSFRTRLPRLTNEMVARIQGWDTDAGWEFIGRKTSVYRQIGNAFPPPVAEAVGRSIAEALREVAPRREVDIVSEHDILYGALRRADGPVRRADLAALFPREEELDRRLETLGRDFDLEVRGEGADLRYILGEFRAFRGQHDHLRHRAFAERATRSRVS